MTGKPDDVRLAAILADLYEAEPEQGRRALDAAIEANPDLAEDLQEHAAMLDLVSEAFVESAVTEGGLPSRIAGYRILEVLGRGGMATVYRAAQDEPIRRDVAVKVLHQRLHGAQALARFDVERESLARMKHSHIASVLDAGFTEDSMPFVVMEFVDGEPITDYCERRKMPLESRLRLFMEVCEAVQHAHQKGIVHRDIKPANVMVADGHGEPQVKVIDFGLAKPLGDDLPEAATLTVMGQILGTPAYMSPEQAAGDDVDARTDVYGLGMLLYEILVGEVAWDRDSLSRENLPRFLRRLAEEDPPRPSTRLSSLHGVGPSSTPG